MKNLHKLYRLKNNITSLSSIQEYPLDGRLFYVKRDDLIDPYLSGNKYRKLYTLIHTPESRFNTIISYGGTQSNAMLAIAALCKTKGWRFEYYTKSLHIKENPNSNYAMARGLGMIHKELEEELYKDYISSLMLNLDEKSFVLHQGGADKSAKAGVEELAQEIRESGLHIRSLATPSGTGTTALYLALALPEYKIYTTPAIGDKSYLIQQMSALEKIPENLIVLECEKKYHFAKPYKEFIEIYQKLKKGGIEFDLVYAPKLWKMILEKTDEEILYIHSGGTTGNVSMLERYRYKGLISV
ncbi:1-aminocyclopropane-1-carboxylate deaminase [Sulfurimonas sp. HSL-1716]|uniref:1-aminocyclopropane-1-carboxylate deaminase n=1 Tax=Hydrocurvibacter sulfurireducens TaxID=3131937 RepID=UPI0031FA0557